MSVKSWHVEVDLLTSVRMPCVLGLEWPSASQFLHT